MRTPRAMARMERLETGVRLGGARASVGRHMADVRDAVVPRDLEAVRGLWLDYLTWGNDELEARHGFRLPVEEAVEHDVAAIAKF